MGDPEELPCAECTALGRDYVNLVAERARLLEEYQQVPETDTAQLEKLDFAIDKAEAEGDVALLAIKHHLASAHPSCSPNRGI
jgi:hypothetical protein